MRSAPWAPIGEAPSKEVAPVQEFTEEKIRDPRVLELIKRISVTHDPALDGKGYTAGNPVEVELNDGTVLSAWGKARGGVDNPVSREAVVEKFRKVTARSLTTGSQDAIIEQCFGLESAPDVSPLLATLRF